MKLSNEEFDDGQVECSKCLGVGEMLPKKSHFGVIPCPKCNGKGKLDWIENIMGMCWSNVWFSSDPDGVVYLYYAGKKNAWFGSIAEVGDWWKKIGLNTDTLCE